MTWLNWRVHRTEAWIGVPLFAILIVVMLLAIQNVDSAYEAARDLGCFDTRGDILCSERVNAYMDAASRWDRLSVLLHGVPLAAAALLVIPTLQEFERGTHRLAWTQSISRRRWTLVRIGFVVGVAILVTVVWTVITAMWRSTLMRDDDFPFRQTAFELSPTVLFGYALFAVALGLAAAVILRKLIPTLATLAVGFIGMRIFTTYYLRERFRSPIETFTPAGSSPASNDYANAWILDETWTQQSGERLSWWDVDALCASALTDQSPEGAYEQCLVENNLVFYRSYHPADRADQFQWIEMMLYLGLAAGLFALAYWWLIRRAA